MKKRINRPRRERWTRKRKMKREGEKKISEPPPAEYAASGARPVPRFNTVDSPKVH